MSTPAHPTYFAPAQGVFEVNLECQNLEATTSEWCGLFGFKEVERIREGFSDETRRFVRPGCPGVVVSFTSCLPRPVMGAAPGCYRRIAITVSPRELREIASRLAGKVRWVEPPPAPDAEAGAWDACRRITLSCTSGHNLCFAVHRPEGSA